MGSAAASRNEVAIGKENARRRATNSSRTSFFAGVANATVKVGFPSFAGRTARATRLGFRSRFTDFLETRWQTFGATTSKQPQEVFGDGRRVELKARFLSSSCRSSFRSLGARAGPFRFGSRFALAIVGSRAWTLLDFVSWISLSVGQALKCKIRCANSKFQSGVQPSSNLNLVEFS